jgi:hypothetical protein
LQPTKWNYSQISSNQMVFIHSGKKYSVIFVLQLQAFVDTDVKSSVSFYMQYGDSYTITVGGVNWFHVMTIFEFMTSIHFVSIDTSQIALINRVINHSKYLAGQAYMYEIKWVCRFEVLIVDHCMDNDNLSCSILKHITSESLSMSSGAQCLSKSQI